MTSRARHSTTGDVYAMTSSARHSTLKGQRLWEGNSNSLLLQVYLLYCDGGGDEVVTSCPGLGANLQAFNVINHSGDLCNGLMCPQKEYIGSLCKLHIIFTSNRRRKNFKKTFISVINQLDAQNVCFTISLFHASACFEHMCLSSGGLNCIRQPLVSSHV